MRGHFPDKGTNGSFTSSLIYSNKVYATADEVSLFLMNKFDETIQHTIKLLNLAELNLMDLPPNLRRRTLELEEEMPVAQTEGDLERFYELIDEWRYIFMTREELR